MLQEILKHKALGNKKEIGFVIFHALTNQEWQNLDDVKAFSVSNIYSIGSSFDGIISLLVFTGLARYKNGFIGINTDCMDPSHYNSYNEYFQTDHFPGLVLKSLGREKGLAPLFNTESTKFDHKIKQFYVKSHLIPIAFFPIRNLLIALEFMSYDSITGDFLFVTPQFTQLFRNITVENVGYKPTRKPITSAELKEILWLQEEAGRVAEVFALKFEQRRLKGHENFDMIQRISESNVGAGFDIISFEDLDSFFTDRYIEVKSYRDEVTFYWSRNEIEAASKLGDRYFLYLVDRSKIYDDSYVPRIIRNPAKGVFEGDIWKREVENWLISLDAN